ncbi:MAG: hypothetical protein LQ344_008079 [Seirophora lacunosa]|nr:MAG: hypothetical protein LQ344_008079 [Seirophora lacunosa]
MAELEDKYWVLEHIDKDGNLKTLNPSDREEDIAPALEDLKNLFCTKSIRAPSTDTKTTHTNTASSKSKIRGGDSVAYGAYLGNSGGIFIGAFRFSGNDTNPPDKRLRPSDLIFQQGKESTDDSTSIRALLGWDIKSRSTLETMQKAQRDTQQPLCGKATFSISGAVLLRRGKLSI